MRTQRAWTDYWKDNGFARRMTESVRSILYSRMMALYLNSHIRKNDEVLEAGCGSGSFASFIKGRYYGIDWTEAALERASHRVDRRRLFMGDITNMPFRDGRFDVIISQGILEFIDDWGPFLKEFARVAKRRVIIIFPSRYSIPSLIRFLVGRKDNKAFKRVFLTDEEIRRRAGNHMKIMSIEKIPTFIGYSVVLVAEPRGTR